MSQPSLAVDTAAHIHTTNLLLTEKKTSLAAPMPCCAAISAVPVDRERYWCSVVQQLSLSHHTAAASHIIMPLLAL